ncbi:MAG: stage II sporulation protein M [Marinilabiliaceae bacterium]|nr:stage II sporulation protein M [Marinilabiliaceae bacterium]
MKFSVYTTVSLSFVVWLIFFLLRLTIDIDYSVDNSCQTDEDMESSSVIANEQVIFEAISNGDDYSVFVMIFMNNIKGCIINILGGFLFSVGTFLNLAFNGFMMADTFRLAYDVGMDTEKILMTTLPHSFELLGFFLSGAIGMQITLEMIKLIKNKMCFTKRFFYDGLIQSLIVFVLIISAAFVEAYISVNIEL